MVERLLTKPHRVRGRVAIEMDIVITSPGILWEARVCFELARVFAGVGT